uniref:Uncharacterized protein n=1 Tax=Oryza punctata TaxID=4537 RepID=A0A0E0JHL8_ORYPU
MEIEFTFLARFVCHLNACKARATVPVAEGGVEVDDDVLLLGRDVPPLEVGPQLLPQRSNPAFFGIDLHAPSPFSRMYLASFSSSSFVHLPLLNPTFSQHGALPMSV